MSKSRPFSIYLLKPEHDAANSLKDAHKLKSEVKANSLPDGAKLFVLDGIETDIWWTKYFGVEANLRQASKGALVFVPVDGRCFALSFGHVYQNLRDECFEHDFGLRVTLNCVDPKKLKSTDTLQPGAARRQRIQSPIGEDLTYFDFDRNSSVLRSLTGKVADKHKALFKDATGASSLSIKSEASPNELTKLCKSLLDLYQSDAYQKTFPDIQNIVPVGDPAIVEQLNDALVKAIKQKNENLYLTIPDLVDYRKDAYYASFSGVGKSQLYEDVFLEKYYEYLTQNQFSLENLEYQHLKNHDLNLADENENKKDSFAILNCLIFETVLGQDGKTYHLAEGKWYSVQNAYLQKLKDTLDPLCTVTYLPAYAHENEGKYNESVAEDLDGFICMDEENISLVGETQVEPCDLYTVRNNFGVFLHVKRSTLSAQMSHLFNQGTNAIELLKLENKAVERFEALLKAKVDENSVAGFIEPLQKGKFEVVFGIVTHKDPDKKSLNLPLFSRISLMRTMRWFKVAGTTCSFSFIPDTSAKKTGIAKKRKKKVIAEAVVDLEIVPL